MTASMETRADEKPTSDDDLMRRFQSWFESARTGSSEWRDQAREDYRFVAGDQWTEEEREKLRAQMRPDVAFNRVYSIVASVLGLEIGQRQEIRAKPRENGDAAVAEVASEGIDWQRDGCDADTEESDAFSDLVTCGLGCTETRMDMEQDPNGMTRIERFSPFEFFWDPASQKKNLADSKFRMRVRTLTYEDAQAEFPDAEKEDLNAGWANDLPMDSPIRDTRDYPTEGESEDIDPKRDCRIVQIQWFEREAYFRVKGPDGQMQELSKEDHDTLQERAKMAGMGKVRAIKATRKVYKQAFVGAKVLESGPAPCKYGFTLNAMTGIRDQVENQWYGLVRHMKDPQRWANKFFSQMMHIINSNAKGGLVIEKSAMVNPRKFQEEWSKPDSVSVVDDGTIAANRMQYKPAITFPSGLDRLMEYAISSIRDTSGVNLELLGMADRQQAGVLEAQRKKSAITILAGFFDALRQYRRETGRTLVYFMSEYYPPDRLMRVLGVDPQQIQQIQMGMSPEAQQAAQAGDPQAQQLVQMAQSPESQRMMTLAQAIPKVQQIDVLSYDIEVDEAPTSPNQEEITWAAMMQVPNIFQALPPPMQIELMPIAATAKQRLLKAIQPPPDPMVQHAKEAELALKDAEVQKTSGEARKVAAEAVEKEIEVQVGTAMLAKGKGPWSKQEIQQRGNGASPIPGA